MILFCDFFAECLFLTHFFFHHSLIFTTVSPLSFSPLPVCFFHYSPCAFFTTLFCSLPDTMYSISLSHARLMTVPNDTILAINKLLHLDKTSKTSTDVSDGGATKTPGKDEKLIHNATTITNKEHKKSIVNYIMANYQRLEYKKGQHKLALKIKQMLSGK